MRHSIVLWLIPLLVSAPALAIEPQRRQAVVVSARVWDGGNHREMFVPSDLNRLVIVSGRDSIVTLVRTWEYYWPLSRKSYVDFETLREPIDGILVVQSDGGEVARVKPLPYVLVYPEGAAGGNASVLWGEEAQTAYTDYLQGERAFRKALVDAQRAQTEYETRLVEAGKARLNGGGIQNVPPPPPVPKPSLRLVTTPAVGFRLDLKPGNLTMHIERDGAAMEGTERSVTVLDGAGRDAIVADIRPEERWTRPIASNDPRSRIYVRPGATFFVTLATASMFEEEEYLAVVEPQARPVAGRQTWVRHGEADIHALSLNSRRRRGEARDVLLETLKVEQTGGSAFGYRVRPVEDGERGDITAFRIAVPAEAADRGSISAVDQALGFEREFVPVAPRNGSLALLLALLPGALLVVKRLGRLSRFRTHGSG